MQQAGVTVAALAPAPRAVLFDLDGTLIDSAPDLAGAVNDMRASRGQAPVAYATLRAQVGSGARGMVGLGFGLGPDDDGFAALRTEFLACYDARKTRETAVFPAMRPVLAALARSGLPWGIVTNKAAWLAEPLIAAIGGLEGAATLVCGDTMPRAKPHPDPLLEAARRMTVPPEHCLYVGDDLRDMQAGRAAGMRTVAAAWGYLGAEAAVTGWQADAIAVDPADLSRLLGLTLSAVD